MEIEKIRKKAWEIHRSDPNFQTYDSEGINTLVDIAIGQAISEVKELIETKLQNIEKARDWSVDLSYPYPEAHAIWKGKKQALEELQEEINSEIKQKE